MKPSAVICGSYHRKPEMLRRIFRELEMTGCRILSPISLNFLNLASPVVTTVDEFDLNIYELEKFHLRTMREADFIWLHAPEGHVGISSAYELGYANALKKPVFCLDQPSDEMLQTRVVYVGSVFEALESLQL